MCHPVGVFLVTFNPHSHRFRGGLRCDAPPGFRAERNQFTTNVEDVSVRGIALHSSGSGAIFQPQAEGRVRVSHGQEVGFGKVSSAILGLSST
jgi:hypothetical protein